MTRRKPRPSRPSPLVQYWTTLNAWLSDGGFGQATYGEAQYHHNRGHGVPLAARLIAFDRAEQEQEAIERVESWRLAEQSRNP